MRSRSTCLPLCFQRWACTTSCSSLLSTTAPMLSMPTPGRRPGLLIAYGLVYTAWSSHCDFFPYTSWVISYSETTLAQVNVLNLTPNGNDGALWNAGAGPAADGSGNVYVLTGNGTFDSTLNG